MKPSPPVTTQRVVESELSPPAGEFGDICGDARGRPSSVEVIVALRPGLPRSSTWISTSTQRMAVAADRHWWYAATRQLLARSSGAAPAADGTRCAVPRRGRGHRGDGPVAGRPGDDGARRVGACGAGGRAVRERRLPAGARRPQRPAAPRRVLRRGAVHHRAVPPHDPRPAGRRRRARQGVQAGRCRVPHGARRAPAAPAARRRHPRGAAVQPARSGAARPRRRTRADPLDRRVQLPRATRRGGRGDPPRDGVERHRPAQQRPRRACSARWRAPSGPCCATSTCRSACQSSPSAASRLTRSAPRADGPALAVVRRRAHRVRRDRRGDQLQDGGEHRGRDVVRRGAALTAAPASTASMPIVLALASACSRA